MPPNQAKKNTKKAATLPGKSDGEASASKPVGKKKTFDIKFSPTRKKSATSPVLETTILQTVLLGRSGNESKQGILFYLTRKDGDKLPCWADKIAADMIFKGNCVIVDECSVEQTIYKLHHRSGLPMIGNKGYERRCYLILVEELPSKDEIHSLMCYIADEVNSVVTLKESQKVSVPDNFIVERDVPFVQKLGNAQTISLCEKALAPLSELQAYYQNYPGKFANFWIEGTMTAKIAAFFGLGSEWIMPSERD